MTADINVKNEGITEKPVKSGYKVQLVWRNIILMTLLHVGAVYGAYLAITSAMNQTIYFLIFISYFSSLGIQVGAHRLWCHRAFKATLPLKLFLAFWQTLALQNSIYEWSRDHRMHHKYSETDADPHNAKRGFFFSHVGWLLVKKHPDIKAKGKSIDCSDLEADPIVRIQHKYYIPLVLLIWGAFPTFVPYFFWGESLKNSYFICVLARYCYTLNLTWCVNSWAHMWGYKPYDNNIEPREATIRHLLMGEGFHNYHHTFPWDYSASELGSLDVFNPATQFIDLFARIGWAYDLKKVSPDTIKQKQQRSAKTEQVSKYGYFNNNAVKEWVGGLFSISFVFWIYFLIRQMYLFVKTYSNNADISV